MLRLNRTLSVAVFFIIMILMCSCNDSKNSSEYVTQKNSDFYVGKEVGVSDNSFIYNISGEGSRVNLLNLYSNERADVTRKIISDNSLKSSEDISIEGAVILSVAYDYENNLAFVVFISSNETFLCKYDIETNKEINRVKLDYDTLNIYIDSEKCVNAIVQDKSGEVNSVWQYDESLKLLNSISLDEEIKINEIIACTYDDKYVAIGYSNDSLEVFFLDSDFKLISRITQNDIPEINNLLDITYNDNTILFHVLSDVYMVDEYDLDTNKIIERYNIDLEYGDYIFLGNSKEMSSFTFSNEKGVFLYDLKTNTTKSLYLENVSTDNNIWKTNITYNGDSLIISDYTYVNSNGFISFYDELNSENIKQFDTDWNMYDICSDDMYMYIYRLDSEQDCYMVTKTLFDGKVVDEYPLSINYDNEFFIDYYLNSQQMIYLTQNKEQHEIIMNTLDFETGKISKESLKNDDIRNKSISDIYMNDGKMYVCAFDVEKNKYIIFCVNTKKGNEIKILDIVLFDEIVFTNNIKTEKYEFYYYNLDGIYAYNGEIVQMIDWDNCDKSLDVSKVHLYDKDKFSVIGRKDANDEFSLYNFSKADESYINKMENKSSLIVAGVDILTNDSNSLIYQLKRYIQEYNDDNNDDVRIVINNYSNNEQMNMDIVTGNVPDIIICNENDIMDMDIFENLSDYINNDPEIDTDEYYMNIMAKSTNYNFIIPEFKVATFYGKESVVGIQKIWNIDDLCQYSQNYKTKSLFYNLPRKRVYGYMISLNLNSYFSDGKYNIGSIPEDLLKIIKRECLSMDEYIIADDSLRNECLNDICSLEFVHIGKLENIKNILKSINNEAISFIGVPSIEKSGGIIEPSYMIGITKNSKMKNESWDFIKGTLGEKFQDNVKLLPVRKTSMNKCKDKAEITDDTYKNFKSLINSTNNIIFVNKEIKEMVSEQMELYFSDEKSGEDVLKEMQKKIDIYVNERY